MTITKTDVERLAPILKKAYRDFIKGRDTGNVELMMTARDRLTGIIDTLVAFHLMYQVEWDKDRNQVGKITLLGVDISMVD